MLRNATATFARLKDARRCSLAPGTQAVALGHRVTGDSEKSRNLHIGPKIGSDFRADVLI